MLLILATVAISMAVDSNGLFARARKAAEDWNKSVGDESTAIENAMLILNKIGSSTAEGDTPPPPEKPTMKVEIEVDEAEVTGKEIPVTAKVTKIEDGTEVKEGITYKFYKNNEPDGASSQIATHTFQNLDETTEYTLKVVATSEEGKTAETTVIVGALVIYVDGSEVPVCLRYTVGTTWEEFINSNYNKKITEDKELKVVAIANYKAIGVVPWAGYELQAAERVPVSNIPWIAVPSCPCGRFVRRKDLGPYVPGDRYALGDEDLSPNEVWNRYLKENPPAPDISPYLDQGYITISSELSL